MSQTLFDSFPATGRSSDGAAPLNPQGAGNQRSCLDSTDILGGQKTVDIQHNGSTYRLQATRLGKLILTK